MKTIAVAVLLIGALLLGAVTHERDICRNLRLYEDTRQNEGCK